MRDQEMTQMFSTWGEKLLQHSDVLYSIQKLRKFKPITVQLAPCEVCDSDCSFCSVQARPIKSKLPFEKVRNVLQDFRTLGAKAVEITGGGNPMLYRDGSKNINDIVFYARSIGYDVGIITNSHDLKTLTPKTAEAVNWVRVSLIQLDEGVRPEEYNFQPVPESKIGLSYILYDGTTDGSIDRIAALVDSHPGIKFVRLAGDCLIKGNNMEIVKSFRDKIESVDKGGKFFFKDIGDNDDAFDAACYVGMLRPYVAPDPGGSGQYRVYICTSHVLQKRTYDLDYALCSVDDILDAWERMNARFRETGKPYSVKDNGGTGWRSTCKYCYYYNNNRIVHSVCQHLPDANFA